MRKLLRIHPLFWLLLAPGVLCAVTSYVRPDEWQPIGQADLHANQIYAYRQWQYTGVKLQAGDRFRIEASGQWSYSPYVGMHGPEGGLWAPDWYPLTGNRDQALGGALIGRVGDGGPPFYVGRHYGSVAQTAGPLYLGINDDLLGDNVGVLTVTIDVTPAPTVEP